MITHQNTCAQSATPPQLNNSSTKNPCAATACKTTADTYSENDLECFDQHLDEAIKVAEDEWCDAQYKAMNLDLDQIYADHEAYEAREAWKAYDQAAETAYWNRQIPEAEQSPAFRALIN